MDFCSSSKQLFCSIKEERSQQRKCSCRQDRKLDKDAAWAGPECDYLLCSAFSSASGLAPTPAPAPSEWEPAPPSQHLQPSKYGCWKIKVCTHLFQRYTMTQIMYLYTFEVDSQTLRFNRMTSERPSGHPGL